jgi:phytoene dehydrogenase-like protein
LRWQRPWPGRVATSSCSSGATSSAAAASPASITASISTWAPTRSTRRVRAGNSCELGVDPSGGAPDASRGGFVLAGDELHAFPGTPLALLFTKLFGLRAKLALGSLLARLPRTDTQALDSLCAADWIERATSDPMARAFLEASCRLSTYVNAPTLLSAGSAVEALRSAMTSGVRYLDGGWQTLVEALADAAESAGASLHLRASVKHVSRQGAGFVLELESGEGCEVGSLVLAIPPRDAVAIAGKQSEVLCAAAEAARPIRAACLDIGLDSLPEPGRNFLLGLDAPFYASVHSATAKLAPLDKALVQAVKYLDPDDRGPSDPQRDHRELESFVDRLQPGWRESEVVHQFLPRITVMHDMAQSARGGLAGRVSPVLPDAANLYLVGDWVGPSGQLVHAGLASAATVARAIGTAI